MKKDKQISQFLNANKQQLESEAFNRKTIEQLNYYHPLESKKQRGTLWIVNLSAIVCVALFILSGGAKIIFDAAMVVLNDPITLHSLANYASLIALLSLITGGIVYVKEIYK